MLEDLEYLCPIKFPQIQYGSCREVEKWKVNDSWTTKCEYNSALQPSCTKEAITILFKKVIAKSVKLQGQGNCMMKKDCQKQLFKNMNILS